MRLRTTTTRVLLLIDLVSRANVVVTHLKVFSKRTWQVPNWMVYLSHKVAWPTFQITIHAPLQYILYTVHRSPDLTYKIQYSPNQREYHSKGACALAWICICDWERTEGVMDRVDYIRIGSEIPTNVGDDAGMYHKSRVNSRFKSRLLNDNQ